MQFNYNRERPKLSREERDDIEDAYEAAYSRKAREKKKKLLLIILLTLLGLIVLAFIIWWFYLRH
jgi:flagellar basal body-associated protein FliL